MDCTKGWDNGLWERIELIGAPDWTNADWTNELVNGLGNGLWERIELIGATDWTANWTTDWGTDGTTGGGGEIARTIETGII